MNEEERIDELIVDMIDTTHGADERLYPVVGLVAYNKEGEQQFGRTAVLPDMPDSTLEAVMTAAFWKYVQYKEIPWEDVTALVADIHNKAQYTYQQEAPDPEPESPHVSDVEGLTAAFELSAGQFLEHLQRISPGMKPIVAAVWNDNSTGFATAAAGPDITLEEWAAMLKTLLGPAVREGQMSADELRAVFDEVLTSVVIEAKRPRPLLS